MMCARNRKSKVKFSNVRRDSIKKRLFQIWTFRILFLTFYTNVFDFWGKLIFSVNGVLVFFLYKRFYFLDFVLLICFTRIKLVPRGGESETIIRLLWNDDFLIKKNQNSERWRSQKNGRWIQLRWNNYFAKIWLIWWN